MLADKSYLERVNVQAVERIRTERFDGTTGLVGARGKARGPARASGGPGGTRDRTVARPGAGGRAEFARRRADPAPAASDLMPSARLRCARTSLRQGNAALTRVELSSYHRGWLSCITLTDCLLDAQKTRLNAPRSVLCGKKQLKDRISILFKRSYN